MAYPNADNSLNNDAMNLYKNDKAKFDDKARNETFKHAKCWKCEGGESEERHSNNPHL